MTGLEHYPAGLNAFQMVPPKGTDKPLKPPRKRHKLTAAQKTVNSLVVTSAEKMEKATAFHHFAGICDFGVTPDHIAIKTKQSILTGKRMKLAIDR